MTTLTIHLTKDPEPNTETHRREVIISYLRSKGIPTEPYTAGRDNHVWVEVNTV
jgi:hypothetical protein